MSYSPGPQFERLLASGECDPVALLHEFAADAYPDLDRAPCDAELARLAERARLALASASSAGVATRLEIVSRVLCEQEGFRGNVDDYYDPRNSYLHEVLARRLGIPISLCLLYQTVAGRCGLPLEPIGAPGHFLLGTRDGGCELYVDAFHGGEVLDRRACQTRLARLAPSPVVLDDACLRPRSLRDVALRVLRNLKFAYARRDEWRSAAPVQERLALLAADADEHRDLGLVYLRTGRAADALRLLERYTATASPEQCAAVSPFLRIARRTLAELN